MEKEINIYSDDFRQCMAGLNGYNLFDLVVPRSAGISPEELQSTQYNSSDTQPEAEKESL